MTRQIYYLLMLCLIPIGMTLAQQQGWVSGKITDYEGVPLEGVSITVKGKVNVGVASSADGNFSLQLENGDVLIFRMVGYVTQEITVEGWENINVSMLSDHTDLDEVVVVAAPANPTSNFDHGALGYFSAYSSTRATTWIQ